MTLVEFLLARIAEDEAGARSGYGDGEVDWRAINATRVLAECEAKRRIVERLRWVDEHPEWSGDMEIAGQWEDAHATLRDLAAVYADHPEHAAV